MPKQHKLKTIQPFFEDVWKRNKTFEVRRNDRDFKVDDHVLLQEYDQVKQEYKDREVLGRIDYILNYPEGLRTDFVVFSFTIIQNIYK